MLLIKRIIILTTVLTSILVTAPFAQASMVTTPEVIARSERDQMLTLLKREDVQQQLVERGIDPQAALARVNQLTNEELEQLDGRISALPAGSGVSNVELLLIIIILILVL